MSNIFDIIGYVAATINTFAFLPQVLKTYKTKSAKDFSILMLVMLSSAIALWFIYGLLTNTLPLIVGNGIALFLVSIIFYYKILEIKKVALNK